MNQPMFEKDIIQTLELCLSKMSQKLKSNFNPCEKLSIQLLQQFRSTLSTYHTCLKRAGNVINQNSKPIQNKPSNKIEDNQKIPHLMPKTKENDQTLARLMKTLNIKNNTPTQQPSGLLCIPG